MTTIQHFENHHKTIFTEQTRRKLSVALLSLTGVACLALLILLAKGM